MGELHSLTDWQVSEASEDAELEDFCRAEASRRLRRQTGASRRKGENSPGHRVTAPACRGRLDSAPHPTPARAAAAKSARVGTDHTVAQPGNHTHPED